MTEKEPLTIVVDPSGKDKIPEVKTPELDATYHHWNKRSRVKWTITLFFGILIVYSARTSMSICAPAIGKELGWNKQISGMALSAFFCGYITTNILGGYLADRVGGEIVIYYTAIGWAFMTLMIPALSHTHYLFESATVSVLLARFMTGVCQGVFFPSVTSILTKHVAVTERSFVYSFAYSGSSVGTIITGFVGSIMIESFGWTSVFHSVGIAAFVWIFFWRYLYRQYKKDHITEKPSIVKPKEPVPWLRLAKSPSVWALFVAYFCGGMCFYNLLSWTPVYFHDAFPESKGWVFNVVPWLVNFIVANASGYLANKLLSGGTSLTFVRKLYCSIQMFGVAVFALLLNTVETFRQALFVMSIIIGLQAFSNCSTMLNSQDLAPKHAGALHGVMNCCGAISGFVGVYLTGYILETTNRWSAVFQLQAVMSFIAFVVFLIFGSGERVV